MPELVKSAYSDRKTEKPAFAEYALNEQQAPAGVSAVRLP
jgi:hypothetical protein